jgi:hypothetical protein
MSARKEYELEEKKLGKLYELQNAGRNNRHLLIKTGAKGSWAWIPYEIIQEQFEYYVTRYDCSLDDLERRADREDYGYDSD